MKNRIYGVIFTFLIVLSGCSAENSVSNTGIKKSKNYINSNNSYGEETYQDKQKESKLNLSVEEALSIYVENYPSKTVTSLNLNKQNGTYRYYIEGVDDNRKYPLKVDAETGAYSSLRNELLDHDERAGYKKRSEALNTDKILSLERVNDIVSKETGSEKSEEWDLESDLGITYWEVKTRIYEEEITVKINAQNGKVLDVDRED